MAINEGEGNCPDLGGYLTQTCFQLVLGDVPVSRMPDFYPLRSIGRHLDKPEVNRPEDITFSGRILFQKPGFFIGLSRKTATIFQEIGFF